MLCEKCDICATKGSTDKTDKNPFKTSNGMLCGKCCICCNKILQNVVKVAICGSLNCLNSTLVIKTVSLSRKLFILFISRNTKQWAGLSALIFTLLFFCLVKYISRDLYENFSNLVVVREQEMKWNWKNFCDKIEDNLKWRYTEVRPITICNVSYTKVSSITSYHYNCPKTQNSN